MNRGTIYATARLKLGNLRTGTEKACEPGKRCALALSLEEAGAEALRGSIHIFATETLADGSAWR